MRDEGVREYFYGKKGLNSYFPFNFEVSFSEVKIFKIGGLKHVPCSSSSLHHHSPSHSTTLPHTPPLSLTLPPHSPSSLHTLHHSPSHSTTHPSHSTTPHTHTKPHLTLNHSPSHSTTHTHHSSHSTTHTHHSPHTPHTPPHTLHYPLTLQPQLCRSQPSPWVWRGRMGAPSLSPWSPARTWSTPFSV